MATTLLRRMCRQATEQWRLDMLYDSQCPLCLHEVKFLQRRDTAGLIKFTDISSPDYTPSQHGGVEYEEGMRVIHAVTREGEVVAGVEVFRQVYNAVGLGWVWAATRLPGLSWLADLLYQGWAGQRMRLTGREDLETIFRRRRQLLQKKGGLCEENNKCKL